MMLFRNTLFLTLCILLLRGIPGVESNGATTQPERRELQDVLQDYIRDEVDRQIQEKLALKVEEVIDRQVQERVDREIALKVEQAVENALNNADLVKASSLADLAEKVVSLENKYILMLKRLEAISKCDRCDIKEPTVKTTRKPAVKTTRPPTPHPPFSRLSRPVMDLDVKQENPLMNNLNHVAALPDGGAAIHNATRSPNAHQVIRINRQGALMQILYSCQDCGIEGLLLMNHNLFVIHQNGTIVEFRLRDGQLLYVYKVDVSGWITHTGSLSPEPDKMDDPDLLYMAEPGSWQVISYRLSTRRKQVLVRGLNYPYSIATDGKVFVVCERVGHTIRIYSATWQLITTFGGKGSGNGQLDEPYAAILSPEGTVLVADFANNRVSEFSITGRFLKHVLQYFENAMFGRPRYLSFSYPYLWVTGYSFDNVRRYKLYHG